MSKVYFDHILEIIKSRNLLGQGSNSSRAKIHKINVKAIPMSCSSAMVCLSVIFVNFRGTGPLFSKFSGCLKHYKIKFFGLKLVCRATNVTNKTFLSILGGPGPFFFNFSNFSKCHKIPFYGLKWVCRATNVANKTFFINFGDPGPLFSKLQIVGSITEFILGLKWVRRNCE